MSNRRKLRSKPPAHRSRGHARKLIDRLGQDRPTICAIPLKVIELRPVRGHKLLLGRDALNYNGALVAGTNNLYYAEDLVQGSQSTWSVLLESPNTPGVFTRESVTEAWY